MTPSRSHKILNLIHNLLSASLLIVCAIAGLMLKESILLGGILWMVTVVCALSGWGRMTTRLLGLGTPDLGLRAIWGASVYLLLAGTAMSVGGCNRYSILALTLAGLVYECWHHATSRQPWTRLLVSAVQYGWKAPSRAAIALSLGVVATYILAAAISDFEYNPWDDNAAYLPFLKRLLDAGEINEPFSFRRLSAYGGQTILQALFVVRGDAASPHAFDHGMCLLLLGAMIYSYGKERNADLAWTVLLLLTLFLLPSISINTASYWSGGAFIFAMYRTAVLATSADSKSTEKYLLLASFIGAATCTLRQNYIPMVAIFLVATLLFRHVVDEAPQKNHRVAWRELALVFFSATALLLPFCVSAYISNKTFLYPLMKGTWTAGILHGPATFSPFREIGLFVWALIEPFGIVVVAPLACALLLTNDTRRGKPLTSMFIAAIGAFAMLVHNFQAADPNHLWRYAFGYVVAITAALVIESGRPLVDTSLHASRPKASTNLTTGGEILQPMLVKWVVLGALIYQFGAARFALPRELKANSTNIREAISNPKSSDRLSKVPDLYRSLQSHIPRHASVAVLLDDTYFLDFSRNKLYLLDTPGWAGLAPGYPAFDGTEAYRRYFLAHGIRYIAFVHHAHSTYMYRREFWLWRLYTDLEFFRSMAAYMIDTIDTLDSLSKTQKVLFSKEGLFVIDLLEAA